MPAAIDEEGLEPELRCPPPRKIQRELVRERLEMFAARAFFTTLTSLIVIPTVWVVWFCSVDAFYTLFATKVSVTITNTRYISSTSSGSSYYLVRYRYLWHSQTYEGEDSLDADDMLQQRKLTHFQARLLSFAPGYAPLFPDRSNHSASDSDHLGTDLMVGIAGTFTLSLFLVGYWVFVLDSSAEARRQRQWVSRGTPRRVRVIEKLPVEIGEKSRYDGKAQPIYRARLAPLIETASDPIADLYCLTQKQYDAIKEEEILTVFCDPKKGKVRLFYKMLPYKAALP